MSTEQSPPLPDFPAPQQPPAWDTLPLDEALAELQKYLQTAVLVELHTIPLYLYTAYSMKNKKSSGKIINVVKQEMLHLALSGNILCSIGGTPRLCGPIPNMSDKSYTPRYPCLLFYDKVVLNLAAGTKDTIEIFVKVEEPLPQMRGFSDELLPEYGSIGQFYGVLGQGLDIVNNRMNAAGRSLFLSATSGKQFDPDDRSWFDEGMAVISDLPTASTALNLIVEQGEGTSGAPIPGGGQSHYEIFKELLNGNLDCYDVVENINPDDYKQEKFYPLMIAADAAYTYMLRTLEVLWQYDGAERGNLIGNNLMNLMVSVLSTMAVFLVQQPIESGPDKGKQAAAPFGYYDFNADKASSALDQLKKLVQAGVANYPGGNLSNLVSTVNGLVDIDSLSAAK